MIILKITETEKIIAALKLGQTIVFPTETSYGLGVDATNREAVKKIFKIKERAAGKPLLVVMSSIVAAKKYLRWSEPLNKLAQKYWPGALTVVGKYHRRWLGKNLVPGVVTEAGTVAVRVPAESWLQALTVKLGRPLVATSANLSGTGEIYEPQKIIQSFAGKNFQPDLLVDRGVLPPHQPTTLVDVTKKQLQILRQGELKIFTD